MPRRPAAVGRFVFEILVPEEEIRPSPGGLLVALEEGLKMRGYQVIVRSVSSEPGVDAWRASDEARPARIAAAV
ncbi:MAG: hypothetical protein HY321_09555 [Armatimonadetes bacterium]|nr:hypothetical protein [Armatimonadota bacterium]